MLRRAACLSLLFLASTGCSYLYGVLAVVRDGRIHFVVEPNSRREPTCVRQIEIIARDGPNAEPASGDDVDRVSYGTYWYENVDHEDNCANQFPLPYATTLKGRHQSDLGLVTPKPLLREVIYDISTTSGTNGYGNGRFVILADGKVRNLDPNEALPEEPTP